MTREHFVPLIKQRRRLPISDTSQDSNTEITDCLLGQYVVIYECILYPGIVIDEDVEDVHVRCKGGSRGGGTGGPAPPLFLGWFPPFFFWSPHCPPPPPILVVLPFFAGPTIF